jgi:energy-coupling factor transporter ATP-binding protein EcfA2
MNLHPEPNTAEAVSFLNDTFRKATVHLVAIPPGGRAEAGTFNSDDEEELTTWIDERQGLANIYFHVNELRLGVVNRKARKSDMAAALFLHADVDDPQALERVRSFCPPPTAIIFSGGGYQVFWRLKERCTDLDKVEALNAAIAKRLGGDNCHNIDRVMRLPGTINLPNAKKRAAGRVPVTACVVEADWSRAYSLDDFPEDDPTPPAAPAAVVQQMVPVGLDELPDAVPARTRLIIETGDYPERPRDGEAPRYPSRSEAVFHVACELVRAGCSDEIVAGVLINPALRISESVLEKRDARRYALKQAVSARAAVGDGWPDPDRHGRPRPTMRNAATAIRRLGLSCSYDMFRHRKIIGGAMLEDHEGEISDDACIVLRGRIIDEFGFDPRSDHVRDALTLLCLENAFHPIRDMLDALLWDGVPRLDRWLITYLGAEDTPLNRAISAIMLIAAVRRVRQPGVKFDQIVVLEGPQGSGKSTAVAIIAGEGNHSDQEILTADAKTQIELMEGVWIYELGEVEGLNRAEVNKIKAFASRTVDRSRMAYARHSVARPRQAIFVGTTNEDRYLRDQTGNRRFWPVRTSVIDLEALRRDRDQLLAEAARREARGESLILPEELWEAAAAEQAERLEDDPWLEILSAVRGTAEGEVVRAQTQELLSEKLSIPPERQTQAQTKRLSLNMRKLGWKSAKFKVHGRTVRGYERPKPEGHRDDVKL